MYGSKLLQSSDVKNDSNNSNNGKSEFKTLGQLQIKVTC